MYFFYRYSSDDAVGDLVAGITVGLTVIPQALAYAGIAGVPPAVIILSIFILSIFFFVFRFDEIDFSWLKRYEITQ